MISKQLHQWQLTGCAAIPTQHADSPEGIPATCAADRSLHRHRYVFGMKQVERPAPVLVTAIDYDFDGVTDALIGFNAGGSQVVQPPQHIKVPKGREGKPEPPFIDNFASPKRAEHAAFHQVVFGSLASFRDGRRFAPGALIVEQSLEHADCGMERRSPAFWCFAVPAAIFELLAKKLTGKCVVRLLEVRTKTENSAVDAGFRFAVKERPIIEALKDEPLVNAADHCASLFAGGIKAKVLQDSESVESNQHAPIFLRQLRAELSRRFAPVTGERLEGEELRAPAFGCDARPLDLNCIASLTGQIPHDLPTDGWIRIKEPFDERGARRGLSYPHWHVIAGDS